MKTKLKRFSKRSLAMLLSLLMMLSVLSVGSIITTAAADTITLYYQKDMPSGNYSASSSKAMTQSAKNTSKYYASVSLQNGSYGFYVKWGNDYYKVSATATTDQDVLLYNYGSTNYGNSNHRVTYSTGAATNFTFTFDTSNNKIAVRPRDTTTVKMAWSTASGHDGDWNLGTYDTMTHTSNGLYTKDLSLTAVKHYMFIQTNNTNYYKSSNTLTQNSTDSGKVAKMYYYGTNNYGGSGDKVNFTPNPAGKYRFTYDIKDQTVTMYRLYDVTYNKGTAPSGGGTISGTVPSAQLKVHGTNLTLQTNAFTSSGYTQSGWATSDGGSRAYTSGATYSTNSGLTLYPYWSENTYSVTFTKKLGSAAATNITTKSAGVTTKASCTAPDESGYNFTGWTITSGSANASNVTGTESASDTTVSLNASGAVTVQANYEEAGTCAITAKKTNSSGAVLDDEDMTIGSNMTVYAEGNSYHSSGNFSVSSSDSSVASVSSATVAKNGTFTVSAKSVGSATITISCPADSKSTTFDVTVSKSDLAATFSSADHVYVLKGDNTQSMGYTATPSVSSVSYSSGNTSIATVNSTTGAVTPVAAGTVTMTVTATFTNGGTDTATKDIKVQDPTLTVSSNTLALDYTSNSTNAGSDYKGTNTFTVTTNGNNPAYAPVTEITVVSNDTNIVTVNKATITSTSAETVTATAKAVGSTNIVVKYFINGTEVTSLRKTIAVTVSAYDVNMTIYAKASSNYSTLYFIPGTSSSAGSGGTAMTKIGKVSNDNVWALNITKKQYYNANGFYFGSASATAQSGQRNSTKQTGANPIKNYYSVADEGSNGAWHGTTTTSSSVTITKPVITAKSNETLNAGATKTASAPTVTGTAGSYLWTSGTTSVATISGTGATPTITGVSNGSSASTVRAFIPLANTGITFSSLETSSSAAYDYIASNAQSFNITVQDVKHTVTVVAVSRDTSNGTYATDASAMASSTVEPSGGVSHNTSATVSATAASGYTLIGYYSAANGGTQYTNGSLGAVTSDMTVYVRFEKKYTLTINKGSNNGTVSPASMEVYAAVKPGNISVTVNSGYRIDWANSTNLSKYYNQPASLVGNVTLTAKEVANINSADMVNKTITIAFEEVTPVVNFTSYKTDNNSTYVAGGGELTATYSTGSGGGVSPTPDPQAPARYLWRNTTNSENPTNFGNCITMSADTSGNYYASFNPGSSNFYFNINDSSSSATSGSQKLNSSTSCDKGSGIADWSTVGNYYADGTTYYIGKGYLDSGSTLYVKFDPSANKITLQNSAFSYTASGSGSSQSSGSGTSGAVVSGGTVPYGADVTFTAEKVAVISGNTYEFIGWYSTAQPAANETALSTSLTYTKSSVNDDVTVYARYKKSLYLTFYNSYVQEANGKFTFVAAPPRTVTVGSGSSVRATYSYKAGNAEQRGEDHTKNSTSDYYEGNRLLVLVGETVTLKFSTLASSDAITGIFFNNGIRYTTETEPDNLYMNRVNQGIAAHGGNGTGTLKDPSHPDQGYTNGDDEWDYTYLPDTTIYADEDYYEGATKTTIQNNASSYIGQSGMDQAAHTVSWVATQSYMNIDIELGRKYQLHINDDKPDGISIANMNDEGYYYGGEIIESTTPNHTNGLKITLDNTTDTTGTYSFTSATPVWKDKDGNTVSAPSGVYAKAYTSGNAETNTPSSIHHWLIYGTMPHSDLYLTIPVAKKYNMKLSNIVVSDNGSSKRTMITECSTNSTSATDCIGTISGKVDGTTQASLTDDGTYYTYPNNNYAGHVEAYTSNTNNKYLNGGVNRNGYNVTAGQTVTYTFSFSSGKDAEYTFVGWFEGTYNNVSNTDFSYDVNYNKKLSGKESFTFTPSKNTVVIAVATRDMYIGGNFTKDGAYTSTASSQTWSKNRPLMDFDPTYVNPEDPSKKGRYTYTFDTVTANTEYKFRCYDTVGTGASGQDTTNLSVWSTWSGSDYANDPDDIFYGRHKYDAEYGYSHGQFVYKTNTNNWSLVDNTASDHDSNKNHQANGYAAPVTVYFYAYDGGMSVSSTYQWSKAYVSEGRGVDVKSVSGGTTTYNSPTASVANKTVNNKDVTVTTNTTSYGHDGMTEKIYECIVKEKDGQIVVTASPKDQNLELQAFLVYNIETKASEAVKGPFTTSGSGDDKTYTGNIKIPNNSKIYVCPIYKFTDAYISTQNLESHNVFVRADDIDKDDWGGLVSMYSWGTTSGYDSGGWPGQLMVPSDDGTSFYAPLVFQKGGLAGVTFNNYTSVYGGDFINFLGKYQDAGVSDVAYSNYTKPTADNNYIYQVFDYREPISIIENINEGDIYDSEDMTLTFALKPGNKTSGTVGNGAYNDSFNYEYLTDSSGKYRVDLNGNKLSTYPTASYYVVCNYTEAYAPGGSKTYDFATSTHNRYSIDWNVYDQNHVLVANGTQLSAAFTDVEKSEMLTYIAKQLIDDGQPVSGKAVKIAYENPKVSSSDNTEAVRYSGQWYADGLNTIIKGNVRVGIYSDGVYTPSDSNSAGYGTATVGFTPDTTIGEGYETETGCSGHSLANVTKTHASNGDVQYTVSSTDNFLGWYRKTKDGDFEPIGSNYKSQAINPSFNEDITLYAFYSASASYRFAYTSRTGSTKYYTAKGTDLTDAELANSGTLNPTTRSADITAKLAGVTDIKVFNHDLTYALTSPDTSSPYTITYTAGDSPSTYTLTVYAYNSSGTLAQVGSKTGTWNTSLDVNNDLTTYASGFTKGSKLVNNKPSDHGNYIFLGWRKYNGSAFEGPIISTKENFGYSITSDTTIAPYFVDPTDNTTINNYISEAWKPGVDNSVVTQELTKEGEGVIFNDNLISFRYGSDTNKRIDGSSIYSGDPNTVPEGKQCGVVVLAQANDAADAKKTAFDTHYSNDTNVQSYVNYFVKGDGREKSSVKMSSSKYGDAYAFHVKAPTLSNLNRANIVQALDYAKFSGGNYKVMSYYYDGSSYVYSDVTSGTLTCS